MKRWIVLLRGINVGGNNILPMKDLRDLLTRFGFENVQTYIQSGNCVLDTKGMKADALARTIERKIDSEMGFRPQALALSVNDFEAALRDNPYSPDEGLEKNVHFFFLSRPAAKADLNGLKKLRASNEEFMLTDRVFYLHAPDGIGRSKLAAKAEKFLKVSGTARNLRSVRKILDLTQD